MEKNRQTVSILDEQDTVIGYTYPKRAKGLVKKRRAEFVSDSTIRLFRQCPTYENMEDMEMDQIKYITVNPKTWRKNSDENIQQVWGAYNKVSDPGVCERLMIDNPLAEAVPTLPKLTEVLSVGSWSWDFTSYVSGNVHAIEPDCEYHFVFWLNGGENDRSDEVCRLQVLFTDNPGIVSRSEFSAGVQFCLNRGYIKPLKKYNGWEYYDIPLTFVAARDKYVQFQLVAHRAPMALIDAGAPELYADVQDVVDPYENRRPQRHNIFFEDGWPIDKWYSTANLAKGSQAKIEKGSFPSFPDFFHNPQINPQKHQTDGVKQKIIDEIMEELDLDDIVDEIKAAVLDDLDMDAIKEEIIGSLNSSK